MLAGVDYYQAMQKHAHPPIEQAISAEIDRFPEEVRAVAGEFCMRGKRVRPLLVGAFAHGYGAHAGAWIGLGAAVEFFHKASLIQDDLPCMDDSAVRSGKPTVHTVFTPAHALLASDAMIGHAFRLAGESALPAEAVVLLSEAMSDLCGGQLRDLRYARQPDGVEWQSIVDRKTGSLFVLSARLGLLAAGRTDTASHTLAQRFGLSLGRLYQLLDDVVDGDSQEPPDRAFEAFRDELSGIARQAPDPSGLLMYIEQLGRMKQRLLTAMSHGSASRTSE